MDKLHHIVVVGGGAGGLELVTGLGNKLGKKRKARITLVDAGLTHVWKPLLHEVASGSLDANTNEINYRAHARKHHYEFQLGRMSGLDRTANDFGTPGAQDNCLFLDSLPALPARLSAAATREFEHQKVQVLTGQPVSEVLEASIIMKDRTELPSEMTIWAAGIKAQAAHQQADTLFKTLFKTLCNRLENGEAVPFVYNDHGSLINFSRYTTVGNLMGNLSGRSMYIEGKVARLFYLSLYRMHQVALHGMLRTGIIWLMDKISRAMHPRLKLH